MPSRFPKTVETVKSLAATSSIRLGAWKLAVRGEIACASGAPDLAFACIHGTEDANCFDDLNKPGLSGSLDAKLEAAPSSITTGGFGFQIDNIKENVARQGKYLKGRQILHRIMGHHKMSEIDGQFPELWDLMDLKMKEIIFGALLNQGMPLL